MDSNSSALQKPVVVGLLAVFCCALWGSAFPSIKSGYAFFQIGPEASADQIIFAGERFTIAGILVILFGSLIFRQFLHPKKSSWKKIAIIGLTQTVVQYIFFYMGLSKASGVRSSIICGAGSFISLLIACLIVRQEKLTSRKLIGCLLGFAGVILVNLAGGASGTPVTLTGEGFVMISTIAYASSSVMLRKYTQGEHPVMITGYQFFFGGLTLMLVGLVLGGHYHSAPPAGYAVLFWLGFIAASAYSVWTVLLKYNPVSKVSIYSCLEPLSGSLLSVLFLHEKEGLGLRSLAALLLICLGIYIINKVPKESEI